MQYNTIYISFTIISDYASFLGCFIDMVNVSVSEDGTYRAVLPNAKKIQPGLMTIGTCIDFCMNSKQAVVLRYAGVENGAECWCGVDGSQYAQFGNVSDSECSAPCAGNANQTCGGKNRIAVYDCKC